MSSRVHVCAARELGSGDVRVVPLGHEASGLPREVLVLRDRAGRVRAYRNLCKHLPIPLDSGGRRFLAHDGTHLLCRTHGATYRPEDGRCVSGPCEGALLDAFEVEETGGDIYVRVP